MPPLSALPPPCPLPCPSSFFSVSKGASQNLKPVPLGGRAHYSRGTGSQPASRPSLKPEDSGATGCCPPAHGHLAQQGQQPGLAGRQGCACHPWPFAKTPKTPVSGSLLAPLNILSPTRTRQTHTHTHLVRPGTCPSPPVPKLNDHITPRCLLRGSHAPSVAHRGLGAPAEPTMPRKSLLAAP